MGCSGLVGDNSGVGGSGVSITVVEWAALVIIVIIIIIIIIIIILFVSSPSREP